MTYGPPLGGLCEPKKPKKKASPEKDVQAAIQDAFRVQHQVALVHVDSGGAGMRRGCAAGAGGYSSTPAGFPDLVGVVPPTGRALYIEVKAPGCKPTDLQLRMLALLKSKGAVAFWADSVISALAQFKEAA
jgi:VRR-NUC domain